MDRNQLLRLAMGDYLGSMENLPQLLAQAQRPPEDWSENDKLLYNYIQQYTPAGMLQVGPLYHGSPYKFSKFADEKIGTGEGAQAFGYGHYLTDEPAIAKDYSSGRVGGRGWYMSVKGRPLSDFQEIKTMPDPMVAEQTTGMAINNAFKNSGGDIEKAKLFLKDNSTYNLAYERAYKILEKVDDIKDINFGSNLYTTTVNKGKPSSADVFLEWDNPISSLPKNIRKTLKDMLNNQGIPTGMSDNLSGGYTGRELYKELSRLWGESKASSVLSGIGITGIKYPAGSLSGVQNSKATNYVIFDPERITIDAVNGKPVDWVEKMEKIRRDVPIDPIDPNKISMKTKLDPTSPEFKKVLEEQMKKRGGWLGNL